MHDRQHLTVIPSIGTDSVLVALWKISHGIVCLCLNHHHLQYMYVHQNHYGTANYPFQKSTNQNSISISIYKYVSMNKITKDKKSLNFSSIRCCVFAAIQQQLCCSCPMCTLECSNNVLCTCVWAKLNGFLFHVCF